MKSPPAPGGTSDHHRAEHRVGESSSAHGQLVAIVEVPESGTDRYEVTELPWNADLGRIPDQRSCKSHWLTVAGADDKPETSTSRSV